MNTEQREYVQIVPKLLSVQELRCVPWFSTHGDQNLRLNYDLTEESIVFDVGGYEGQWAGDIFSKYHCTIHTFEPVEEYANQIGERFAYNNKVLLHRFGLAGKTKKAWLSVSADGSSIFKESDNMQEISLIKAIDFIKENDIHTIDLMKINIEGGEYELLEHLIDADFIRNIINLQVQFHDFVPGATGRMVKIQEALQKTHYLSYQYEFVWENWRKKSTPKTNQEYNLEIIKLYDQIDFDTKELLAARRDNLSISLQLQNTQTELHKTQVELHNANTELQKIKNSISFKLTYFILHPWCFSKHIIISVLNK
jgi:FkbM family methyltransferase